MLMEYPTRVRTLPAPMPTMAGAQRSATRPVPAQPDTARLLGRFAPISLVHMDGVALQDRIDTKLRAPCRSPVLCARLADGALPDPGD